MIPIDVTSRVRVELIDVTAHVREAIRASGIRDGLAIVYTPHTTAAITINENADPDVARDLVSALNKLVPFDDHYRHAEGNSAAHVKSSLVGISETLIVQGGTPLLGTWQGVYLCEFDGPRRRQVQVRVVSA